MHTQPPAHQGCLRARAWRCQARLAALGVHAPGVACPCRSARSAGMICCCRRPSSRPHIERPWRNQVCAPSEDARVWGRRGGRGHALMVRGAVRAPARVRAQDQYPAGDAAAQQGAAAALQPLTVLPLGCPWLQGSSSPRRCPPTAGCGARCRRPSTATAFAPGATGTAWTAPTASRRACSSRRTRRRRVRWRGWRGRMQTYEPGGGAWRGVAGGAWRPCAAWPASACNKGRSSWTLAPRGRHPSVPPRP